ncbi:CTLH/CRA C-terminal to lish motif domain-containing protein [Gigaspora margarita]|uniref:CTLH/CRA C-terminal to lish motif domain-containing protein n=1 Tax=Gigaspora margarita TaxID=4874 RepID=A0A8H4A7N2_GIGMA|nr:CTLH/CRA C-terminal to lish motif domain-containing protein [Gigaspora margarita]
MDPCSDSFQNLEEPDDRIVRRLVLDYLIHNCYGETARIFLKDSQDLNITSKKETLFTNGFAQNDSNDIIPMDTSETDADGDLEMVDSSDYIHVNATNNSLPIVLKSSKFLPAWRNKRRSNNKLCTESALESLEIRKKIREFIISGDIPSALSLCRTTFPEVVSTEEGNHLTTPRSTEMCFKLQLQQFIETVRSGNFDEALTFAQSVVAEYPTLRDEFTKVSPLIAYEKPENSPSAPLLSQEHRDKLADEINSAILSFDSQVNESALERLIKQAIVVREYLHHVVSKGHRTAYRKCVHGKDADFFFG